MHWWLVNSIVLNTGNLLKRVAGAFPTHKMATMVTKAMRH